MDKAECKAKGLPWPLWECISGNGDFVPHPGEERFDFPCSAAWRDFYSGAPEQVRAKPSTDEHVFGVEFTPVIRPAKIVLEVPQRQPRSKGVEL